MEAQYGKFLDVIRDVQINIPFVDALAGMSNYGKFLNQLEFRSEHMILSSDSAMKHSYSNGNTCFSIDVIDEILEEDFDALLDEGNKILYSIEGTPLEDELFFEFDEFIAMNIEENIEPKNDKEELIFEKNTFNTDHKIKNSFEEPPIDLELKPLPDHLEYAFLEGTSFLPMIISSQLSEQKKPSSFSFLMTKNQ
ncbi:hypothetical protein Tco_0026710 [Tanacetum coccineum]